MISVYLLLDFAAPKTLMTDNDRSLMTGQPFTTSLYFFYVKERNNMRMFIIFLYFCGTDSGVLCI